MIRLVLSAFFGLTMRIFFRRIEIFGQERVPATGPVMIVLNHPNALIDPAFMLCFSPRPVSFLAKSTLFSMPVIGTIVRGFECLPVYRRRDNADPSKNRETFDKARALLDSGNVIAIFPEGTSHDDTRLKPLKTGAARIALGAASQGGVPVSVVPAGLYFTEKTTFRSDALIYYGEPITADPIELDDNAEPARPEVRALTERIARALTEVTLQAEQAEAIDLVARAEALFAEPEDSLADRFALKQRILVGYVMLKEKMPARISALRRRIEHLQEECDELGVVAERLAEEDFAPGKVAAYVLKHTTLLALLVVPALVGAVVHVAPYHLIDWVAKRQAKGEQDMLSTIKVLAALLFFPLTWLAVAIPVGTFSHPLLGLLTLSVAPLCGLAALVMLERAGRFLLAARAAAVFVFRRREFERVVAEQASIRDEIVALGELIES